MKLKLNLLSYGILAALLLLLSTSSPAQKIDYYAAAAGTSFAQYKTYKWHRADKAQYPEKVLDEMFIRTINAELAAKGLTVTESDDADLIVTYQIAIMEDMEWSAGHSSIPWQGMVGAPGLQGGPVGGSNTIKKGSFILDLYDVKQRRQVWQANATKTLANTTDFQKREKNTRKAMAKIFKNYPPRAK